MQRGAGQRCAAGCAQAFTVEAAADAAALCMVSYSHTKPCTDARTAGAAPAAAAAAAAAAVPPALRWCLFAPLLLQV